MFQHNIITIGSCTVSGYLLDGTSYPSDLYLARALLYFCIKPQNAHGHGYTYYSTGYMHRRSLEKKGEIMPSVMGQQQIEQRENTYIISLLCVLLLYILH